MRKNKAMEQPPKDNLVERIKAMEEFIKNILNGGNSPELSYEEAAKIFALLTDCLTALEPRLLNDGELEGMYQEATGLLIRASVAEPCLLDVNELGRKTFGNPVLHGLNQVENAKCQYVLTALHDALARKEG